MTAANFFRGGHGVIALTLIYLILRQIDLWTAAALTLSGFLELLGIAIKTIGSWVKTLPLWQRISYMAAMGICTLGTFFELGITLGIGKSAEVLGKVLLYGSTAIAIATGFLGDYYDSDGIVGHAHQSTADHNHHVGVGHYRCFYGY